MAGERRNDAGSRNGQSARAGLGIGCGSDRSPGIARRSLPGGLSGDLRRLPTLPGLLPGDGKGRYQRMLIRPSRDAIHHLARMALDEDAPWGDLTSQTLIAGSMRVTAQLVAREPGTLSGEDVFIAAMSLTDACISTRFNVHDGESFSGPTALATIEG